MALDEGPFVFRINDNGGGPNLLNQVCVERGWREYSECGVLRENWNLWWRTTGLSASHCKQLKPWQYTNHIPKGSSICRKDNLARYLKCMRKIYGSIYEFSPPVYHLPLEYTKLVSEISRFNRSENNAIWICKPVGQSQGRGIFLFKSLGELTYDNNAIVQRYIQNPLLIGGYKFDLRLYVCIPSFHPLAVYVYREGLTRFSTDKFSLADLTNPFCHLTNSSLNKWGPGYREKKDRVGSGCKWTLKQLRHYFYQANIPDWLLWQRIACLIVLTVASQLSGVPQSSNCFEFYGFDVLIDSTMKPWLLEVNLSPALGNDSDVDPVVKKPMLHDLFDLLGLPVCNTGLSLFTIWSSSTSQSNSDDFNSSDEETENHKVIPPVPAPLYVVEAATRWKRWQQQKDLEHTPHSAESSTWRRNASNAAPANRKLRNQSMGVKVVPAKDSSSNHRNIRAKSSQASRPIPVVCVGEEEFFVGHKTASVDKHDSWQEFEHVGRNKTPVRGHNKILPVQLWGNGRDWRSPPAVEGNWVRVYPFTSTSYLKGYHPQEHVFPGDKEVKTVVAAVHKFLKTAREIFQRNHTLADEDYNSLMKRVLNLTSEIWLPNK